MKRSVCWVYCVDGFTNKVAFSNADYPAFGDPAQRFVFNHCDNVQVDEPSE